MLILRTLAFCLGVILVPAHARAQPPGILIDFRRLVPPDGLTDVPPTLINQVPPPSDSLNVAWVWIDPADQVKVGFVDGVRRTGRVSVLRQLLTLDFGSLDAYRASVRDHRELSVSDEMLSILRDRHRELALHPAGAGDEDPAAPPVLNLQNKAVREAYGLGEEFKDATLRVRNIELLPDRQIRLNLDRHARGRATCRSR